MSSADPFLTLNDCGCCEGISVETPGRIFNRPGLSAVVYRVGTHPQFKATMLARLGVSGQRALERLTTRDDADFTIALLDAAATVGDVLTFYQERIANEAYLRTATERLSVLELGRLIGYQLRPGVAASTYLAFTLEDAPGTLGQALSLGTTAQISSEPLPPVVIDAGSKVQSVPEPGEQAQTFETVEPIEARAEWNAIRVRLAQPQNVAAFVSKALILDGTTTGLKPGDALLVLDAAGSPALRIILSVVADEDAKTTRVNFVAPPADLPRYDRPAGLPNGNLTDFPTKVELVDSVVQQIVGKTWSEEDLSALAKIQEWPVNSLTANIAKHATTASRPRVFAFRQQAAIFGHNAPSYTSLIKPSGGYLYPYDWDSAGFEIWKDSMTNTYYVNADLYLERSVPGIVKDSIVVLQLTTAAGTAPSYYTVNSVSDASIAGFGMSAKSTGLRLAKFSGGALGNNPTDQPAAFKVRTTTVLLQSEELTLADLPIVDDISGDTITLDRTYLGLKVDRRVVLTGERSDLKGVVGSEALTLQKVVVEGGFTVLTFERPLVYSYYRKTPRLAVTINANVARATHGETVQETLGGGDAGQAFPRFTLRQPPLTHVTAPTPTGGQTTLEVRVDDVLWHEVPSFPEHGPEERIYTTRLEDDGKTTVIFGDGTTGARLPTGQENVKAKYRKGIGLGGLVKADRLTQLMTRPLGVKGVTNPLAATGGADPEQRDEARRNAPLTVLTFGRIVSLQDYEDFARAFSGIAKALATWTWFGEKRGVFVTVAGSKGAVVKDDSQLFHNLVTAMQAAGDPTVPLRVASYQPRLFQVSAVLKLDPDLLPAKVLADVTQTLRDAFAFEARDFGQPVHFSEVVGITQNVRGVLAADITEFHRSDQAAGPKPEPHLAAAVPRPGDTVVSAAELLTLDPRPLILGVQQ
jgi:predicted phage baseplate assembly protein